MHSISETVFVHAVFFFSLNQWHPEQVKKKKKRERKREKEELNIVFIVLQCKLKISNHLANLLPNGVLAVTSHTNCMLGGGWRKKKKTQRKTPENINIYVLPLVKPQDFHYCYFTWML